MRKNLIYLFSTVMALSVAIPGTATPSNQIAEKERGAISLAQPSARLAQPAPDMRMDFMSMSDIMEQQSSLFVKQLQLAKSEAIHPEDEDMGIDFSQASGVAKINLKADATTPPYSETFDTKDAFSTFTVIDVNEDNKTWFYSSMGNVRYRYSSTNTGDDWLITPPLNLQKGSVYTVSFDAKSYAENYPEKLEVKYGTECSVAGMTTLLMDTTTLTGDDVTFTYYITATEDGPYYIFVW